MRAARVLESLGKSVNTSKQIGHVSGIEVGDEFLWRGELSIVGLHHGFQRGIDCMKLINDKIMATSIVDSGRYENAVGITSDKLIYCGEGENPDIGGRKKPNDQKLVGGNLALKNSMDDKMPVRVIHRVIRRFNNNYCGYKFVYDGLYRVTEFWKEKGKFASSNGRRKTDLVTAGNSFGEVRNGLMDIAT
ncbi:YDG domain-containing protein At5g47160-like [Durio zibethinus]|uniref:YDG domain-containing protein At5g47160-like n=1 Tax=Durio zibethinus TaxID=66656 RepID=A0A6P6ABD3_DURZI|nr:YDG domain-containing protein At5g47160-like [Durio zibethinus]